MGKITNAETEETLLEQELQAWIIKAEVNGISKKDICDSMADKLAFYSGEAQKDMEE